MAEECTGTYGPNFPGGENGDQTSCTEKPGGGYCPPVNANKTCGEFQLSDQKKDNCLIDNYVNEALNIGAAPVNVYKLLGVHEQCRLVDSTGQGGALSGGSAVGFPPTNAFDQYTTEWRSQQTGSSVPVSGYVGYDFGPILATDNSRRMHGISTSIRKNISAFAIKQAASSANRITRARLERSDDGIKWYGVQVVNLPDDDCLNTILVKDSVPSRYWRLRPTVTPGDGGNINYWAVKAFQMFNNYVATDVHNIQDKILMENRDRDYAEDSLYMKMYFDLSDITSDLSRFVLGLDPSFTMVFTVSFSACVAVLGRPIIIGDIFEVPSEAAYSAKMKKILRWMEVTDVAWASDGYTPGWKTTMLRVIAAPAMATQETQDIFGDLAEPTPDEIGYVAGDDGNNDKLYQDYFDVSQTIEAYAKDKVPEKGREVSGHIRQWSDEEIANAADLGIGNLQKTGEWPLGLYSEDGMPPNNEPFTEGDEFPDNPKDKDYHRLTYSDLSRDVPPRLYRYSDIKDRWIWLETDLRAKYNPTKPLLQEFLTPKTPSFRRPDDHIVSEPDTYCDSEGEDE